jgi:phosphocarrier protein HPr
VKENEMPQQVVKVASTVGLHARPASLLVKESAKSGLAITIGRVGEKPVNAASMLSVLALGIKFDEAIEVTVADGENAEEVLATLVGIISTNHDEENPSA